MKFENPIMNISMFEVENVLTASGETPVAEPVGAAAKAEAGLAEGANTIKLTF